MGKWIIKLLIWLLIAVVVAMTRGLNVTVNELSQVKEDYSKSVTWDLAERLKWLEATRQKMKETKVDIEATTELQTIIGDELTDQHINYWLLQETANIYKEEIKEIEWLN